MEGGLLKQMMFEIFGIQIPTAIASSLKSTLKCVQRMASELKYTHLGVNHYTRVFFLLHAFYFTKFKWLIFTTRALFTREVLQHTQKVL